MNAHNIYRDDDKAWFKPPLSTNAPLLLEIRNNKNIRSRVTTENFSFLQCFDSITIEKQNEKIFHTGNSGSHEQFSAKKFFDSDTESKIAQ